MRDRALALTMTNGQKISHGQANDVGGIHYEGFCLLANGLRYVSFHCYPDKNGALP
jgi:hypothetical protein